MPTILPQTRMPILDTWNELQKYPFDMNSAERQVISNDINHPKVAIMVTAMPTTIQKSKENSQKSSNVMQRQFLKLLFPEILTGNTHMNSQMSLFMKTRIAICCVAFLFTVCYLDLSHLLWHSVSLQGGVIWATY